MQNLAIFHESNKDAAYYRQQVSERGILEKIDAFNEGLLEIKGVTVENLPLVYEVLNEVEISLNKNANDPRTRMALQNFAIVDEKVEEKTAPTEDDDTDDTKAEFDQTENTEESADGIQKLTEEPTGEPDPAENTEETTDETQEPTTEPTGEPATEQQEPTGEPDPTEKVDTQEPATEPAAETPEPKSEPKKGGRRKKDAE